MFQASVYLYIVLHTNIYWYIDILISSYDYHNNYIFPFLIDISLFNQFHDRVMRITQNLKSQCDFIIACSMYVLTYALEIINKTVAKN